MKNVHIVGKVEQGKEDTNTVVEKRLEYLQNLVDEGKLDSSIFEYIVKNGILVCPASTKWHGNYEGGLFDHCKAMYEAFSEMTERLGLKWTRPQSVGNVSWGHDVCKLDAYVKNTENSSENAYKYNPESTFHGHGMKSAVILQQHARLTEEELYCIIYHMGAYETNQWEAYEKAIKKYPNVLFTHTADMCASKIVGV